MIQYLVILLDDTSVSFCHYACGKKERRLMPLDVLKKGIVYAIKENLNIQFVYPDYELPSEYLEAIDSIDHVDIKPAVTEGNTDVVVFNGIEDIKGFDFVDNVSYVLRTDKYSLFCNADMIVGVLGKLKRFNIVITDVETFGENDFNAYSTLLEKLTAEVEKLYVEGGSVQLNLLTDRMMLNKMNNCGAGDTTVTLAPDGRFYVCPAFYLNDESDVIGKLGFSIGSLDNGGLDIKNPQLYRIDHAPLCRNCDAYQCRRCIWLNRKTTFEVNTPSHEQCVVAHLERNASRNLLSAIRKHGTFLPEMGDIKEINYLDPFDVRKG